MKTLIAIPSKNRVETLTKNTWGWAKDITKYDVNIFVEPQDHEAYKVFGESNLVILDDNNQGLGYAKRFIQTYAEQNGYDLIFKLDDDTKAFTNFRKRCPINEVAKLVEGVLSEIEGVFEQHETLGAVAFPYRFHLFKTERWTPVKKVQSSYVVRTQLLCPPFKFSVFEDFAVALNNLVKGYNVLRYNLMGQDSGVAVGEGSGGLQDFDRSELAKIEAEQLRKMYPPLTFRKVDKPWKIEPDVKSIKL